MPKGSCHCGRIKYEFTGEPVMKALCHCLACHKSTGSTYATVAFVMKDQLTVHEGKPKEHTETHENGMKIHTSFCDECGSTMFRTADGNPVAAKFKDQVAIFIGTLDDMDELDALRPTTELNTPRRTKWLGEIQGAEQRVGF